MLVFTEADSHEDDRRKLTAFRPTPDFPKATEAKVINVKSDGVILGKHSHNHVEGFLLASGSCLIKTWTETKWLQEQELSAPTMFIFEPGEEHLLTCSKGTILVGYMPVTFEDENNTPATHV
ncbi:MAG: hypothetical protein WCJ57_02230 [Candidatus Falkowbacteria bacterium]